MNDDTDRHDIKIQIAKMYHIDGLSQGDIAKRINLSRPSVSRLLKDCIAEGIVEIRINDVSSQGRELSEKIKKLFSVRQVIVVPQSENLEADKEKVGFAAASYIETKLKSGMLIGISWGTMVLQVVKHIKPRSSIQVDVIELIGNKDSDANMMAIQLSKSLNGECYLLKAPFMVQSKVLRKLLMDEPNIKSHFNKIKEVDIAVIGIGSVKNDLGALYRSGHITYEDLNSHMKDGVVGDLCGRLLCSDGSGYDSPLNERMLAVTLEDIKNIPMVIGVAAGEKKSEAILGALRGGYIDVLIIDEKAAVGVINLNQ